MGRYQKGKTNLDITEARDSEWQWHQLEHMQVCTSLRTDNHASTPPLCFLQAGCPSCRPTNSVKALTLPTQICPSVRLSVPSIGSSSGVRAGLLLSAPREGDVDRQQAPVLAVAGSVVLTAKERG